MEPWLRLALAVLATWRVTHLLAREDGPGDLVVRLRARVGEGLLGRSMDCFYCLSVWVAAPMAFAVAAEPVDLVLAWLGLSGAACLVERLGHDPGRLHPLEPTTEEAPPWDAAVKDVPG